MQPKRSGKSGRYFMVLNCDSEYEPDSDLRATEQVPLLEDGGIEAFILREVLPYPPDAWVNNDATKIGYEISFTRHFYKPQPLRTLAQISAPVVSASQDPPPDDGEVSDLVLQP